MRIAFARAFWSTRFARVRMQILTRTKGDIFRIIAGLHCGMGVERQKSHAGIVIGRQQLFEVGRQLTFLSRILVSAKSAEQMCDNSSFSAAWG